MILEKKTYNHLWFAWFPIKVNNFQWVWLENVQRKYSTISMQYNYSLIGDKWPSDNLKHRK